MLKRKLNAVVSLLTTVLLLVHAICLSAYMLFGDSIGRPSPVVGWALMGLMIIHVLISMDILISMHAENGKHKGKHYPKLNAPMVIQRASGVLMVPAAVLHIAGATGAMAPPKMVHAIVPPLFFAIVLTHIAASTGKALITLGIGDTKFIKAVNIAMRVICGATWIAGVIGIYLRTFTGGAA